MHLYQRIAVRIAQGVRLSAGVVALVLAGASAATYLGKNAIGLISAIESGSGSDAGPEANRVLTVAMAKGRRPEQTERLETRQGADTSVRMVEEATSREPPITEVVRDQREPVPDAMRRYEGTYRTLCVRECDGGFFPVSFSTTPERFARDAATCRSRCDLPARLFVYPNIGGSVATMIDLEGRPYSALANAGVFRTERRPACACRPEAWQQEAQNRHRILELLAAQKANEAGGNEVALRTAIEEVRRTRPGGLAALTSGVETSPERRGRQLPGDGEPVIGGHAPDPSDRPQVAVRFAGELKPARVVYDATGRAVLLKQPTKSERPAVAIIARVVEIEPAASVSTGSLSEASQIAIAPESAPAVVDLETVRLERAARARADKATPNSRKQHQAGSVSSRRKSEVRVADRRRTNVTASAWYGNRVYTGSDWRISNYQILE